MNDTSSSNTDSMKFTTQEELAKTVKAIQDVKQEYFRGPELKSNEQVKTLEAGINQVENSVISGKPPIDHSKLSKDENCKECTTNYSDPTQDQLIMYLHAYEYSGDGWSFKTNAPAWAGENIDSSI